MNAHRSELVLTTQGDPHDPRFTAMPPREFPKGLPPSALPPHILPVMAKAGCGHRVVRRLPWPSSPADVAAHEAEWRIWPCPECWPRFTAAMLERTAEKIRQGWTPYLLAANAKGMPCLPHGDDAKAWSLLGALVTARWELHKVAAQIEDRVVLAAIRLLVDEAGLDGTGDDPPRLLVMWESADGRTQQEVLHHVWVTMADMLAAEPKGRAGLRHPFPESPPECRVRSYPGDELPPLS